MKLALAGGIGVAACGGIAVVDSGSGGASGSATTDTVSSSSSSGGGCDSHEDCPNGTLCVFASGQCTTTCSSDFCDVCPAGEVCDECGTSSCPQCLDCTAVCVPAAAGECDDHDDCGSDEYCIYSQRRCAPACNSGQCSDPNLVCADCATSSCSCCDDCKSACLPL